MPSHVVFGAGLIGCFLGGVLKSRGLDTRLVCRPNIQAKLVNGLKLTDYLHNEAQITELDFVSSEDLSSNEVDIRPADFLWLTVKCTGVEQAILDIKPLVSANTIIMCCQNGLGSEQGIKRTFADNTVLRVMVPFNVAELSSGHLHRGSEGAITIEVNADFENKTACHSLVSSLQSPIMPVAVAQRRTQLDTLPFPPQG